MGEGTNDTIFSWEMVVAVPLQVLVHVCGFPVYSNRQLNIILQFYNGVQEGDGTILLVVLHCKLYSQLNTVDVLKEVLFIFFLLDNKGVIHIPLP